MRIIVSSIITLALFSQLVAQSNRRHMAGTFAHDGDIFGTRVFVENKGQFDQVMPGETIHFAVDNGIEKIYFTGTGLIYEHLRFAPFTKRELERIERDPHYALPPPQRHFVKMSWENARQHPAIQKLDQQAHYISYGDPHLNSRTYKKLLYNGVYPGIDIEFTIPADKESGIKYNVIVHPGADLSKVKQAYSGDVKDVRVNENGEVVVRSPFGEIVEHAPYTYYSENGEKGAVVASRFNVDKQVVSFQLPEGYDRKKTLVVDPWVQSITSLISNQYAYDVDYDFLGNTYIYGGYNPYKVARYSNTGVLQWTFAGTVPSQSWSSAPIVGQASNFAVNKYNGKCYIGQGYVGNGNRVIRIDAGGNYDNFINVADGDFQEVWDMGFHCTNDGDVFVLGGGTSSNISAVTINPTTAVITLATFQPTNTGIAQDVASHAIDDAGKIFVLYAGSAGLNNKMCLVNPTFNDNIWTAPSTFNTFNEQGNKNQYQGAGSLSSNGFNALAVNANHLFYYDGSNLSAYDKTNGTLTASTIVPGVTIKRQGGIAVDDCNNLYLGGNDAILCYNFNGTSFSAVNTISLNLSTTNKYVYDIKLDKPGKLLYVSGSGFVGTWSPINSLSCPTGTSLCFSYQLLDHIICAGQSATLAAVATTTLNNTSYTLQPGNSTNSTGSFAVNPLATTVYTIFGSGVNSSQGVVTFSAVSTVSVFSQPNIVPTATQATCVDSTNAFNLNLTWNPANAPASYTVIWSAIPNVVGNNQQTFGSGVMTSGVYGATVTTDWGCRSEGSFTIAPVPEKSNFALIPGSPYILSCLNPTKTFSFVPATYNYTTSNGLNPAQFGPNPSITFTNSGGIYTVLGEHPVSKCVSSQTFVLSQNTVVPQSALSSTFQNITCANTSIQTITATANPTVNILHEWISPQNTTLTAQTATAFFVPGGPGVYRHCLSDVVNGCRTCKDFTISSNDVFPTFSVNSAPANFTLGCLSKGTITINITHAQGGGGGAVSYSLLPPSWTGPLPSGTLSTLSSYQVSTPGDYTLVTRDNANGCDSKVYVSVLTNTLPPAIDTLLFATNILTCDQPSVVLQGISSAPNIKTEWQFGGNLSVSTNTVLVQTIPVANTETVVDTYTFQVTDNNNLCVNTATVLMLQNIFPPIADIAGDDVLTCVIHTIMLSNNSSSQIPPFFNPSKVVQAYYWEGPSPQVPLQISTSYVAYMPGVYTLLTRDASNGCFATATHTISDFREFPVVNRPEPPDPLVLDCGQQSRKISANITPKLPSFTYSWVAPPTFTVTDPNKDSLIVYSVGMYEVFVTNPDNGCVSHGFVTVTNGELEGEFEVDKQTGYAPLVANFTNKSFSTLDTSGINSVWNFGNGEVVQSVSAGHKPQVTYSQPGTYEVVLYVSKGTCVDTVVKYIEVDIPSHIEIPNVFTPNGDGTNDVFFLKTANITNIQITVYNRWGGKVYELNTDKGNIEWDGKNQFGKDVPDGVYLYTLKATGKDGAQYERQGDITITR